MPKKFLIAIDLGAGEGAKIGLFAQSDQLLRETLLPVSQYGDNAETLADALIKTLSPFLHAQGVGMKNIRSIGLASPGLFRSDGTYLLAANLPFLNGMNLKRLLAERAGVPVGIENDANAGGLAEWSVLRIELLYWVFGGGWGGAWISKEGEVRFPAVDWDGADASLHYTNEPGYSIPLEKLAIREILHRFDTPYERLERILIEDLKPADGVLRGPGGSPDHLRAEMLLSGPGRCRIFRAVLGDDDFYERFLEIHEAHEIGNPAVAGKHISKLSGMRVEAAVNTDRIFGNLLAHTTRVMFKRARKDGLRDGTPICLGGKPSYALPYFGPSAQRVLGTMGITSYLRPSIIDERGSNANLVGAAVLAEKIANGK
ncbi:MAG: ROK family protein [Candidatus Sumerlaeota bacterium]|nr:ROK family protein [Candidatus Sumerlaeota bacterium]